MLRQLLAAMSVCVGLIFTILLGVFDETRLARDELYGSRGGESKDAKCKKRCDAEAGIGVGCSTSGAACTVCGHTNQLTYAHVIGNPGDPGCGQGGFELDDESEDCGTIWDGICVWNASQGQWICQAVNTQTVCTNGIMKVQPQEAGPIDP
jgi:hypothetical protein